MNALIKALKSRTVWTIIFIFVFNGFQAVQGSFSPEVVLIVNALLSLTATYFRINPSK